jgi:hypothetical protein
MVQQKYQHTDKCKQLFHFSSVEGSFVVDQLNLEVVKARANNNL